MVRRTKSKEEPEIPRSVNPERGIQLLQSQMKKAEQLLANRPIQHADHLAWENTTKDYLTRVFGSKSSNIRAVISAPSDVPLQAGMTKIGYEEYEASQLQNQIKILQSCIEQLETEIKLGRNIETETGIESDSSTDVLRICKRFHVVAKQLRKRHDGRPTLEINDEYDMQDLLHSLLKIHFDDIRPEEWTPGYAGGASKMDFLLKKEKIVIEAKKTRENLTDKKIGEQLLVDIAKYEHHPDCKTLVCFIYDPEGKIGNPGGLENDLNKSSNDAMRIIAIVEPS